MKTKIQSMSFFAKIMTISVLLLAFSITDALAVGVKPLRNEVNLDPGESETFFVKAINEYNRDIKISPEIDVYIANDERGFPIVAEMEEDDPRNIRTWIKFEEEEISIPARTTADIKVTITAPKDAEPGGKYASVVMKEVIDKENAAIGITPRVASLILVKVNGDENIKGELKNFSIKEAKIFNDKPVTFDVDFKNTGNVHAQPSGEVIIKDENGRQLEKIAKIMDEETNKEVEVNAIPVNEEEGNVLPESNRIFKSEWTENIKEGKFTAEALVKIGKKGNETKLKESHEFEIMEDFKINDFKIDVSDTESKFIISVENNGKIYEMIKGKIEITNNFGEKVRTIEFPFIDEEEPENSLKLDYVAPGEKKDIIIPWLSKKFPDGGYTAKIKAQYGLYDDVYEKEIQFGKVGLYASIFGPGGFVTQPLGMASGVLMLIGLFAIVFFAGKRSKKEEETK